MQLRTFVGVALAASSLAACAGSGTDGKKSTPSLLGLKDHPAVQAIESGGVGDAYVVSINLEAGSYKVLHGESLDHLASAEGNCTEEELERGRELFTQGKVDQYETDAVSDSERRLQFIVTWPDGAPKARSTFSVDPSNPPSGIAPVTTYTRRYIELYSPPVPTTDPVDAGCPDGELCPDLPPSD
jgi:hypothetical protein